MRLEPLYRVRFRYPEGWSVGLAAPGQSEGERAFFFLAEGRCEGRVSGRFRGANHPVRRSDGTFMPNFQGVIETDDGATVLFDMRGYGRAYPAGRRQIVAFATHVSEHERYRWLNDVVCASVGEVREAEDELVVDVAELVWEPLTD
jgi:hypothetical protein